MRGLILVVDDDPDQAEVLASLLRAEGYEARVLTDLKQSDVGVSEGSDIDVVLCNLELRHVDWAGGARTLAEMRVRVPVIMYAREASAGNMMTSLRLGAHDFFPLPIGNLRALCRSIDHGVRIRSMARELRDSRKHLEAANRELHQTVKVLELDQQAGRQVQLKMLPTSPLVLGDYVFSHVVIPSLYLSGDFTDYFTVGESCVVFFLADVSGHGSSSAFATVLLKNLFARKRSDYLRRNDRAILDPAAMLRLANRELLDLSVGKFATMVVCCLDMESNQLSYSVAGHLPLPVLASDEGAVYLQGEGSPVGLMEDADFAVAHRDLPDGYTLALFSDGILETLPPSDLVAKEAWFLDVFNAGAGSPTELASRLGLDRLESIPDDVAALFVSRRGAA